MGVKPPAFSSVLGDLGLCPGRMPPPAQWWHNSHGEAEVRELETKPGGTRCPPSTCAPLLPAPSPDSDSASPAARPAEQPPSIWPARP